ncbi:MAG: hypothetical protein LBB94_05435 [Clostridiales bacterium]|jgi:hypothetical protein|nr:hypothetical protein [Clostridiales bacterium]
MADPIPEINLSPADTSSEAKPPEKIFTQADVDKIIQKRLAEEHRKEGAAKPAAEEAEELRERLQTAQDKSISGAIRTALALEGIRDKNATARIARLIDRAKCADAGGEPDESAIEKEVAALKKEYPELFGTAGKIGGSMDQDKQAEAKQISKIFGNIKI